MKRAIVLTLLISISCFAVFTYPPEPETRPAKVYPKYLLCLRYWSYSPTSNVIFCDTLASGKNSDELNNGWCWVYLYETYNSLGEVTNRLNTYTGRGMQSTEGLVGLWRLDDNIADKAIRLKTTKHIEPEHIEKREWTEYNWEVVDSNK